MLGEIWDVYDAARRRTGAAARRGEPLPPGGYHLVVHVCLFCRMGGCSYKSAAVKSAAGPGSGT